MAHPLFFKEEPEDRRAHQEQQYEEKLVGHLLSYYKLSSYKSYMRNQAQKRFGKTGLRLDLFVDMFGYYPVRLGVAKIPGTVKNCTVDRLFNKMSTRKIVEHYLTALEEQPDDGQQRPFALVFPWTFIPKGMVLHNRRVTIDEHISGLKKPCVRITWTLPAKKRRHGAYLTFEPLDQFLATIAWEPQEVEKS